MMNWEMMNWNRCVYHLSSCRENLYKKGLSLSRSIYKYCFTLGIFLRLSPRNSQKRMPAGHLVDRENLNQIRMSSLLC